VLEAVDPSDVDEGRVDKAVAPLLVLLTVYWPVGVRVVKTSVVSEVGPVATMVPLIKETSNVEVVVTVTVRSVVELSSKALDVLLTASENTDAVELRSVTVLEREMVSDGAAVGGEVVSADADRPEGADTDRSEGTELATLVAEDRPGRVTVPTSDRDTTVPVDAAEISVATVVVVPSLTLISTTLAVTVASGARGRRFTPAFRRGIIGRPCCCSAAYADRRWTFHRFIVFVVGVIAWSLSAWSPRIPISEVNSPSVILDPVSRGFCISESGILNRFAGRSMTRAAHA